MTSRSCGIGLPQSWPLPDDGRWNPSTPAGHPGFSVTSQTQVLFGIPDIDQTIKVLIIDRNVKGIVCATITKKPGWMHCIS